MILHIIRILLKEQKKFLFFGFVLKVRGFRFKVDHAMKNKVRNVEPPSLTPRQITITLTRKKSLQRIIEKKHTYPNFSEEREAMIFWQDSRNAENLKPCEKTLKQSRGASLHEI